MTKHTPGPWSNDGIEIGTGILHEVKIAKCFLVGHEETHANARLIAAAPELCDVLQQALPYLREAAKKDGHANGTYQLASQLMKRLGRTV